MKIQYALVQIRREREYPNFHNDRYFEMAVEEEFYRADTEQQVESWLEAAFAAVKIINAKLQEFRTADVALSWQDRNSRAKKDPTLTLEYVAALNDEYKKLLNDYSLPLGKLVDVHDEYRIVKIYSVD